MRCGITPWLELSCPRFGNESSYARARARARASPGNWMVCVVSSNFSAFIILIRTTVKTKHAVSHRLRRSARLTILFYPENQLGYFGTFGNTDNSTLGRLLTTDRRTFCETCDHTSIFSRIRLFSFHLNTPDNRRKML